MNRIREFIFCYRTILTARRLIETSINHGPPTQPPIPTLPTLAPSTTPLLLYLLTTTLVPSTTPHLHHLPTWHLEPVPSTSLPAGPAEAEDLSDTRWPPAAPAPRVMSEAETSPTSVSAVILKVICRVSLLNFDRNTTYVNLDSTAYILHKPNM